MYDFKRLNVENVVSSVAEVIGNEGKQSYHCVQRGSVSIIVCGLLSISSAGISTCVVQLLK